jgi:hypothetical protein
MTEGAIVSLLDAYWPERGGVEPEAVADLAKAFTAQFGIPFDANAEPFVERHGEPRRSPGGRRRGARPRVGDARGQEEGVRRARRAVRRRGLPELQ